MDFKTISVPVIQITPNGELVETPMSLHLSLPSSGDDEHIFIFGGKTTLYKALPVKKDITTSFPCLSSCDYHTKWMTPRESFPEVSRMLQQQQQQPQPVKDKEEQQQRQQQLYQCSHCLKESAELLYEYDKDDDEEKCETIPEEEPVDLELAESVDSFLRISEKKVVCQPANISIDLESNCSSSDGVASKNKSSMKARVYKRRKWKWELPDVVPVDNIITSRNEFKLIFYCIHMKDPKRLYTIPEIRRILCKLGYTGKDRYGPVNSARSHLKHFKRADLLKPRGCKNFMEMTKNEKKVKIFSELAEKLLLDLEY